MGAFSRKRLRERFITFASAVYNVCIRGCKRYPWWTHVFAFKVDQIGPGGCSALQGRMQCTAEAVAVHCGSGCSALRLSWVKLTPKSPVLFYKCQTTTQSIFRITFATLPANVCKRPRKRYKPLPQTFAGKKHYPESLMTDSG